MNFQELFKKQQLLSHPMSPIEFFKICGGKIWQANDSVSKGRYSIELYLNPFTWEDKNISTSIRLDFIDLKNLSFSELAGKTFSFPVNPDKGYIDGSVYLESCHNPIDVTLISFGITFKELHEGHYEKDDYIIATLLYKFVWEGENADHYPEVKRANVILKYESS